MTNGTNTELLQSSPAELARAADALRAGELVAFPTETVYGLGADALNQAAVAKVFAAKGRPQDHPLIVHLADADELTRWTSASGLVLKRARLLAGRFWPGPLTLVLPRSGQVLDSVTGGQDTVALRCPAHPLALGLLKESGLALVAPSANRFGRISPTTADHVLQELDGRVRFVLDGGPSEVGLESTIVDVSAQTVRVLRPGAVLPQEIAAVLEEPVSGPGIAGPDAPRVSGSLASHYAPVTPTHLAAAEALAEFGEGSGVIARGPAPEGFAGSWLQLPADPAGFGRGLYAALRQLDGTVDVIVVQEPPEGAAWDAVRDRLRRASA